MPGLPILLTVHLVIEADVYPKRSLQKEFLQHAFTVAWWLDVQAIQGVKTNL